METLLRISQRYGYCMGSPEENAAVGISLLIGFPGSSQQNAGENTDEIRFAKHIRRARPNQPGAALRNRPLRIELEVVSY